MAEPRVALVCFGKSILISSAVLLLILCITLSVDQLDLNIKRSRREIQEGNISIHQEPLQSSDRNCTLRGIDSFPAGLFTSKQRINGAILIDFMIAVYLCGAISYICAAYFVPSTEMLGQQMDLRPDVAGATFMAAGSSAPEFFTAVIGTFVSMDDTGIGAIIGSAAFNIFVITAICCFFTCQPVVLTRWPFFRDIIVYVISIILLSIALVDDRVEWWEGLILSFGYVFYIGIMYFNSQLSAKSEEFILNLKTKFAEVEADTEVETTKDGYGTVDHQPQVTAGDGEFKERIPSWRTEPPSQSVFAPPDGLPWIVVWFFGLPVIFLFFITIPDCRKPGWQQSLYLVTFIMSAVWLAITTYVLYWMIAVIGYTLNVPDTVMGLSFLAAGTSLPDTVASMLVARDGFGNMAMANIFGSNIFEVFACLGFLWFIAALANGPVIIASSAMAFDSASLILMVVFIVFIIYLNNWTLNVKTGIFCVLSYIFYLSLSILNELGVFGIVETPNYCSHV
ncbi:sodium/potassium/calcium exchanger 5-like [Apostichopus japonicus]|uniref:sodium/potassium/calcium exchanger 5-like n=1 Tax=Stichopus japonicus TaxID=307972 RepID=UPI003AB37ADD